VIGYEHLVETFSVADLSLPPIPTGLREDLRVRSDWVWSTRPIDSMEMYVFREYVREALQEDVKDYVAVSHAGHGANSYGLNYHLVYGDLCVFTQDGFGGAYMDEASARRDISETFSMVTTLLEHARVPAQGRWLYVVASRFRNVLGYRIEESAVAAEPLAVEGWTSGEDRSTLAREAAERMWGSRPA
jgi:hypothetical protein